MKVRQGFVSNSSSSSFLVRFPYRPKSVEQMRELLYGDKKEVKHYDGEMVDTNVLAEIVFSDLKGQRRLTEKIMVSEMLRGWPQVENPDFIATLTLTCDACGGVTGVPEPENGSFWENDLNCVSCGTVLYRDDERQNYRISSYGGEYIDLFPEYEDVLSQTNRIMNCPSEDCRHAIEWGITKPKYGIHHWTKEVPVKCHHCETELTEEIINQFSSPTKDYREHRKLCSEIAKKLIRKRLMQEDDEPDAGEFNRQLFDNEKIEKYHTYLFEYGNECGGKLHQLLEFGTFDLLPNVSICKH